MTNDTKAILLLDDHSRQIIKTNIAELNLHGIGFVNNLGEISDDMLRETQRVIVLEGYLQETNSLADLRLFKALQKLDYYYIGCSDIWLKEMHTIAVTYKGDITHLDIALIQCALFGDDSLVQENLESKLYNLNYSFAQSVLKDMGSYDAKVHALASEFINVRDYVGLLQKEIDESAEQANLLQLTNTKLVKENAKLVTGYSDILFGAKRLNESLKQYEDVLTRDIYEKINLSNYPNKPNILYIKEFEELLGFETLIETLFDVFSWQNKQSVKVLRLYDSSGNRKIATLPKYYKKINGSYLTQDLIVDDFLCKTGDYLRVLNILLTNRSSLDMLIIIDCKDHNDEVLSGSFLQFNTCRNKDHLIPLNLIADNTIVNYHDVENYLCWEDYKELETFSEKEKDKRFLFLSSRELIQKILEMSRLFVESV